MEEAGITLSAVWMRYFSFTGAAGEYEIDAYLNGSLELPAHERDLVSHAVNELIKELPPRRMAPYSPNGKRPAPGPKPTHDGARRDCRRQPRRAPGRDHQPQPRRAPGRDHQPQPRRAPGREPQGPSGRITGQVTGPAAGRKMTAARHP